MPAHEVDQELDRRRHARADELQMLKLHGTESQRERWGVGLLPEDELLAVARTALFAPFKEFRRWQKLQPHDVRHDKACSGGSISFTTRTPRDLDANEWAIYKQLRVAVNEQIVPLFALHNATASIELVEHVGACSRCPAEVFGRAASIRIEWAGRPLSREYSLEAR